MDMISYLLGFTAGKKGSSNVSGIEEIYDALDQINGEIIGETLYYVTFIGADGAELGRVPTYEGHDCEDPVASGAFETPTKEGTRYYGWAFSGWSFTDGGDADSDALKNISGDLTLYAAFTEYEIFIASGYCSDGLYTDKSITWGLNPDYVLKFTRNYVDGEDSTWSGSIKSYFIGSENGDYPPWYLYAEMITAVIVGEGIKEVGMYNFTGCTALTSVSFPSTLRSIDHSAFEGCTSLTSITIPAAVKYIYGKAFYGCTALASAIFEETAGWSIYTNTDVLVQEVTEAEAADAAIMAGYLVNAIKNEFENSNAA